LHPGAAAANAEIRDRIERILRGELIEREEATDAGRVPMWYGARSAAEIAGLWVGWMATATAIDLPFYQAGAIGWASRS
jgi:hypothetical protein